MRESKVIEKPNIVTSGIHTREAVLRHIKSALKKRIAILVRSQ